MTREDAIKTLHELWRETNDHWYEETYNMAIEALKQVPSANVAPVRQTAEWVYGEKDGADGWYCSKCKFHIPWYYEYYGLNNIDFIRDFHTCPHCDAKMTKYTGMKGEWDAKIH